MAALKDDVKAFIVQALACFQATSSLGENPVGGIYGAAANESWIVCGLSVGYGLTFGTTIKRIEASA